MEQEQELKQQPPSEPVKQASTVKSEAWEWTKALLIAAALVFFIRWFIGSPFVVEGPSMQPNFQTGEKMIVNKILYTFRQPQRGEVIVFHAPDGRDYIKRVIALPGEKVRVDGDQVYINGEPLQEPYLQEVVDEAKRSGTVYNNGLHRVYAEQTVPEGTVFAMGDNRPNSMDSRDKNVGFVPFEKVVGRADVIYWPLNQVSLIH
ncbi:signal peptidase I [Paenibacillus sp. YYML68]|uniref:signal peptidase I n=1 Tax=Paenibacillus sp. YYML68 TaxID=2909250 RepID=UPI0024929C95|nr:signal peptidase I [Paenibacillus sp. YYML68]